MFDPYSILDIPRTADDRIVRNAYIKAISDSPPERDRERFEQVRQAYEAIGTEKARLAYDLFDKSIPSPVDILGAISPLFSFRRPEISPDRLRGAK
ncbi:MAG: DnaJ domain-containing protein [Leptospirillum sp.]